MAAATQVPTLANRVRAFARRVRAFAALLPVRFDDRRFWIRATLGLLARLVVIQWQWWILRSAMTDAVAWSLTTFGFEPRRLDPTSLGIEHYTVSVSLMCTHIEVFALIIPLLWDRSRIVVRNLAGLTGLGALIFVLGVLRIDLAVILHTWGLPWGWAHDVPLGVCYALLLGFTLQRGAWMRRPRQPGQPPPQVVEERHLTDESPPSKPVT